MYISYTLLKHCSHVTLDHKLRAHTVG